MSTLQVSNVHFNAAGTTRLEYIPTNTLNLYVGDVLVFSASQTSSGVVPKYSANVGNAVATSFSINHFLNKQDVFVSVRDTGTNYFVYPDIKYSNTNVILLEFASAPSTNQYYVSVIGA